MKEQIEIINPCIIEVASVDDWEKLKNLWLESLTTDPQAFGYSYEELANRTEEEWKIRTLKFSDKVTRHKMFVAKDGDNLIGKMGYFERDGEKGIATIYGVYVKPEYRRRKIANILMEKIFAALKQDGTFEKMKLAVNQNQIAAVKFYQRQGFEIVDTVKDEEMGDGTICDENIMMRNI